MADIRLTPEDMNDVGFTPTRPALATGNAYQVRNDGQVILLFIKTGAGAATITFTTSLTEQGLAVADRTLSVAALTGDEVIGPFSPRIYNDANGDIEFTTSEGTAITCAALRRLG